TSLGVDYMHYAVSVKVSEHYDLAVIYSVVEPHYKKWKSFFRSCWKTVDIEWPELADSERSSSALAGSKSESGGKSDASEAGEFVDTLITRHGKMVEGRIEETDGGYVIAWEGASIKVPADLVKQVEYGDPERNVAQTEEDKENMAKGFVKFKGRWISRSRYETELKRARQEQEERIARLREHSDPGNPWREERSRFILETTTSEELMNHYADLIDTLFSTYERTLGVKVSNSARKNKPTIRVFKDAQEYQNFSKAPGTGGYFSWTDNSLNLYHNFEDPSLSEKTLLHEGTHLLNYLSNSSFIMKPMWVEEGAAEFFGSSDRNIDEKGKIDLIPGQILGNRLLLVHQRIETGEVEDLRDALATNTYQYEDYAYWWSTFHFLMTHDKYSNKFLNFYRNLYELKGVDKENMGSYFKVSPEDAVVYLEKSLGIRDWAALQAEWEQFIEDSVKEVGGFGWFVLGRDLYGEAFRSKFMKTENMDDATRMEIYRDTMESALANLNKAIDEKNYHKAEVYYYRHLVLKDLEKPDEAMKDIEKALESDPLNGGYYYSRATLKYRNNEKTEAQTDVRIAMALDPMNLKFPVILKEMEQGSFVDLPPFF
ncbi:MAG: DUF1570 domain-containing protein, partial [Planctomycetes bacterium]|nr:DUF1570 domain-containing protein [Planctomycetota bacterium]